MGKTKRRVERSMRGCFFKPSLTIKYNDPREREESHETRAGMWDWNGVWPAGSR